MRFPDTVVAIVVLGLISGVGPGGRVSAQEKEKVEVLGTVYPIREPDMVEWMKDHAASVFTPERLARLRDEKREALREYAKNPPGTRVPRTSEPVTRWFDPSITVPYDLRDSEGRLIHAAGTTVNPLDYRAMTRRLLFFDGEDREQVRWAAMRLEEEGRRTLPILVAGSPMELGKRWQRPVYFDQRGLLVAKLGIRQVPAVVVQEGNRLRIDEVRP